MKQEPSVVLMSLAVLTLVKKNSLASKEKNSNKHFHYTVNYMILLPSKHVVNELQLPRSRRLTMARMEPGNT